MIRGVLHLRRRFVYGGVLYFPKQADEPRYDLEFASDFVAYCFTITVVFEADAFDMVEWGTLP